MPPETVHSKDLEQDERGGTVLLASLLAVEGMNWGVVAVAIVLALIMHGTLGLGASKAPVKKAVERMELVTYKPKPPPAPPPPPPPEPQKPKPPPPKPIEPPKVPPPLAPPPPSNQPPPPNPPSEPVPVVTGLTLNSTVKGSGGPAVRVGNTTYGDPNEKFTPPADVKAYAGGSPDFKAVRASTITSEARVLKDVKARYPRELADSGIEGAVVISLEISKAGAVHNARVVKSSGNATLDGLALDAVRKFVFKPAEVNGEAVDSNLRYTYRFELVE
jgi:protein TonB